MKAASSDVQSNVSVFEADEWCNARRAEQLQVILLPIRGIETPTQYKDALKADAELCKKVSQEVMSSRFDFLSFVANAGDVEAMLTYESNLFQLTFNDPSWVWQHADKIPEMRDNALHFLEQAATSGVKQAYVELSNIYRSGRYGNVNIQMANWYNARMEKANQIATKPINLPE